MLKSKIQKPTVKMTWDYVSDIELKPSASQSWYGEAKLLHHEKTNRQQPSHRFREKHQEQDTPVLPKRHSRQSEE